MSQPDALPAVPRTTPADLAEGLRDVQRVLEHLWGEIPLHRKAQLTTTFSLDPSIVTLREAADALSTVEQARVVLERQLTASRDHGKRWYGWLQEEQDKTATAEADLTTLRARVQELEQRSEPDDEYGWRRVCKQLEAEIDTLRGNRNERKAELATLRARVQGLVTHLGQLSQPALHRPTCAKWVRDSDREQFTFYGEQPCTCGISALLDQEPTG